LFQSSFEKKKKKKNPTVNENRKDRAGYLYLLPTTPSSFFTTRSQKTESRGNDHNDRIPIKEKKKKEKRHKRVTWYLLP